MAQGAPCMRARRWLGRRSSGMLPRGRLASQRGAAGRPSTAPAPAPACAPCTLLRAAEAAQQRTGATVVPLYLSLDPRKDTPADLKRVAQAAGHPAFAALTGDADGASPSAPAAAAAAVLRCVLPVRRAVRAASPQPHARLHCPSRTAHRQQHHRSTPTRAGAGVRAQVQEPAEGGAAERCQGRRQVQGQ